MCWTPLHGAEERLRFGRRAHFNNRFEFVAASWPVNNNALLCRCAKKSLIFRLAAIDSGSVTQHFHMVGDDEQKSEENNFC